MRWAAVALAVAVAAGGVAVAQPASPAPATVPPWTHPFLWRIEGARPSYLLGTMHLPDARTRQLPPAVTAALAATDGVALELRMDVATQLELAIRMRAPRGGAVRDLVPAPLRERLRKVVVAHHGSWSLVERMRPWMAAVLMTFMAGGPPSTGPATSGAPLDVVLHDWAIDHGKPSDGLETPAEQSTLGDGLSVADQLALLEEAVDRFERGKLSPEPLREAYFAGDERRAVALLRDHAAKPADERLQHVVLDERNVRLAERIHARLQTGAPTFFAVGLGHVLGKGGIVERLRQAGYRLTSLR